MKALPLSEEFHLLQAETAISVHVGDEVRLCVIKSLRKLNRHFIVSFYEVVDRDAAAGYRGALLSLAGHTVALREGEYFYKQIIGLDVFNSSGEYIGKVVDILNNGAHDVYVVGRDRSEYLIPAVSEFIAAILPDENRIIVKEIEGLFD